MPIAILVDTPNMSAAQYDAAMKEMGHVGKLPDGCQSHVAGPGPNGWRVVTVWESEAKATAFRDQKLMPTLKAAGLPPPAGPPTIWQVHNHIK